MKTLILVIACLFGSLSFCCAQNLEALYDVDSTLDWGWNVFVRPDSNYLIFGAAGLPNGQWTLMNMVVSADGNTVLNKHTFKYTNFSAFEGDPGQVKKVASGGYVLPLTIQTTTTGPRSLAGMARFDKNGDTLFTRTDFTDSSVFFEFLNACTVMPDGGYLFGGGRQHDTGGIYPGLLIRTDSMGNMLWTQTYQKLPNQRANINTVNALDDGRILVGAMSSVTIIVNQTTGEQYDVNRPWFMVLDSAGNILKDTLYNSLYGGGGYLYKDRLGGYFHTGAFTTTYSTDENDLRNFPDYIAHLDTDFHIEWITSLTYTPYFGHRSLSTALQVQDNNFVVCAQSQKSFSRLDSWAAKIDRNDGTVLWNHTFTSDTNYYAYFRAVAERQDGSLIFTGATFNDTMPAWHDGQDMWLVGLDSNGCVQPGCDPDTADVEPTEVPVNNVNSSAGGSAGGSAGLTMTIIYPNPSTGSITIENAVGDEMRLVNIEGQVVMQTRMVSNKQVVDVSRLPAAMYIAELTDERGYKQCVRVVKE